MHSHTPDKEPDIKTPEGFERAYNLYAGKMYSVCRSQISDPEWAREIVHDIFLSMWERRNVILIKESLEKYLIRATKLKIIDFYRLKSRENMTTISYETEQKIDPNNDTESQVNFQDLKRILKEITERLPHQSRKIFQLSREQGLTNKEIASTLFISEKTVEYHIRKVLNFIRRHLS